MASTFRGKAQVSGTTWVADIVLYPIANSLKLTQEFDEDTIQDELGDDTAWRSRNEKYMGDVGMVLIDKSAAGSSTLAHAQTGAAFFAPYAILTITTCLVAAWNTTYQIISGGDISQENNSPGRMTLKLRRYANSTQNTLAANIPT